MNRKELKRRGRRSFKRHYLLFAAACLAAALLSSEFRSSLTAVQARLPVLSEIGGSFSKSVGLADVWADIAEGDMEQGSRLAEQLKQQAVSESLQGKSPIFGRSRGVLANLVNQVSSGSILVTLAAAAASLAGSQNAGILLLVLAGAFVFFLFWFLIQNLYPVILRRIFLEGRCYEEVPLHRFAFLLRIKKWLRAAWVMFVKYVFLTLWSLTLVGGVIKHYSYFLVPYLVAENPDLTARQAISLSRRMMQGHKWECFLFELSFLGWFLLGSLTLGLGNLFFTNPYQIAAFTEFYVMLRQQAKERDLPGAALLRDRYLYEKPDQAALETHYGDALAALRRPPEAAVVLPGWKSFLARQFGILLLRTEREREYERRLARQAQAEEAFPAARGRAYPTRLSPQPEGPRQRSIPSLHYLRCYSVWSLAAMFFLFALIGWLWEVCLMLVTEGMLVNRGSLHGPWLPIYGVGGLLMLTLLNRFRRKPLVEFIAIITLSGFLEYFASYLMELLTGMRWWDYSGYFLNLNGRICAEGLLVFGVGGMAIVYLIAPLADNLLGLIDEKKLQAVCLALVLFFGMDLLYSSRCPNQGEGITDDGHAVVLQSGPAGAPGAAPLP